MILNQDMLGNHSKKWLPFLGGISFIGIAFVALTIAYLPFVVFVIGISDHEISNMETVRALFWLLLSVALFIVPVWIWLHFVHKRTLRSLISPYGKGARSALKIASIFFAIYFILGEISGIFLPSIETEYVWKPALWVMWILPIAVATFLQTSAEEIVFRGYFQQYFAALIPIRWVYYTVPTLVWMSLHFGNVAGYYTNFAALFSIFILGIIFADWVDRSKSLWGPMIVHFLNNFILICFFGNSLEKSDMHIWRNNFDSLSDPSIAGLTVLGSCFMAITYIVLRPRIHE